METAEVRRRELLLARPRPPLLRLSEEARPQAQGFLYHPSKTVTARCRSTSNQAGQRRPGGPCSGKPQPLGCPLCSLRSPNLVFFPQSYPSVFSSP